jgi:hypothetical protein
LKAEVQPNKPNRSPHTRIEHCEGATLLLSVPITKIEFAMLEAGIGAERSSVVVGGASVV